MFYKSSKFVSRLAIVSGAIALAMSGAAMAQTQGSTTGLGQAWPNATDVSLSPNYHVYVFVRDGINYIQVNDLNGTVHGAVAAAGGQVLALPIGVDASSVQVSQSTAQSAVSSATSSVNTVSNAAASTATAATETVYNDGRTQITATPQNNGAVQLNAASPSLCQDPQECSHGTIAN